MRTRTTLSDEPEAIADSGIVEREVETVRTREHVTAPTLDGVPASVADIDEQSLSYVETLPRRLSDLGFVLRASILCLLGIRFLLRASGANLGSGFGGFVEGLSWIFAWPFAGLFPDASAGPGVIEFSTLVAIPVYLLVFALLRRLYRAFAPRFSDGAGRRAVMTLWSSNRPLSPPAPDVVASPDDTPGTHRVHTARRRYRLARRS